MRAGRPHNEVLARFGLRRYLTRTLRGMLGTGEIAPPLPTYAGLFRAATHRDQARGFEHIPEAACAGHRSAPGNSAGPNTKCNTRLIPPIEAFDEA